MALTSDERHRFEQIERDLIDDQAFTAAMSWPDSLLRPLPRWFVVAGLVLAPVGVVLLVLGQTLGPLPLTVAGAVLATTFPVCTAPVLVRLLAGRCRRR